MIGPVTEVSSTILRNWAYQRRKEVGALLKNMTIKDDQFHPMEDLEKKLSNLEAQLGSLATEPALVVWEKFLEWLDGEGEVVWTFYLREQAEIDKKRKEEELYQARQRFATQAATAAIDLRNKHAGGPGTTIGTVVAGLVDINTGEVWVGTSGVEHHTQATHPVMSTLLSGTAQAEDWPVQSCAEVDAMKQYLHAKQANSVGAIQPGTLIFHAETWDDQQKKWKSRAACKNCSQWFSKIDAQRI